MARMSIFNPNMAKLLPKFMKADETDVVLSHAMDVLLAEPANRAKILRKWDQIDNMNDAQLDEMAWEFNIDWWDSSFSLETKRSVICTCYRVHEKRGTKWAVEELITSAFGIGGCVPRNESGRVVRVRRPAVLVQNPNKRNAHEGRYALFFEHDRQGEKCALSC